MKRPEGIDIVPVATVEETAPGAWLSPTRLVVAADCGDTQLQTLRLALGEVALAAVHAPRLTSTG